MSVPDHTLRSSDLSDHHHFAPTTSAPYNAPKTRRAPATTSASYAAPTETHYSTRAYPTPPPVFRR